MAADRPTCSRFRVRGGLRAALLIPILAAVACGRVSERDQHSAGGVTFQFDERIGWLHGSCLAIRNPNLTSRTLVSVVIAAEPQKVQQARIAEKTDSPEMCTALTPGRAAINARPGMFFYALEAGSLGSTDMGFGIVAPSASPEVVNGLARVDLDLDGHKEVFSSCATTEGIKFAVWTEKAYEGEPRWSGYYFLDYETKPTCP